MANAKNQDQFLTFIEQNKGIIYKVANLYCKDAEDRKDLVQEIIVQLWKAFEQYNSHYKMSTWMYRISLNVAISFYRKETRRQDKLPIIESMLEIHDEVDEKETNILLLQQFINELKELDKALMLLYLEENSYKEMADILGISESNVATKISRIKEKLKIQFSKTNI